MKIIAFTGKKGTGKSTCCAYLEEKYGFTRVNFKDALIAELKQNFPELLNEMVMWYNSNLMASATIGMKFITVDDLFIIKPPLVRTLMQNYGTNVRRHDDPDYWVKRWALSLIMMTQVGRTDWPRVTTDDVRFLNEAQAVKDNGGIIIRLVRTDMEHTDTHISETEMDSIVPDFTIVCNGNDFEHLHAELDRIIHEATR